MRSASVRVAALPAQRPRPRRRSVVSSATRPMCTLLPLGRPHDDAAVAPVPASATSAAAATSGSAAPSTSASTAACGWRPLYALYRVVSRCNAGSPCGRRSAVAHTRTIQARVGRARHAPFVLLAEACSQVRAHLHDPRGVAVQAPVADVARWMCASRADSDHAPAVAATRSARTIGRSAAATGSAAVPALRLLRSRRTPQVAHARSSKLRALLGIGPRGSRAPGTRRASSTQNCMSPAQPGPRPPQRCRV